MMLGIAWSGELCLWRIPSSTPRAVADTTHPTHPSHTTDATDTQLGLCTMHSV